MYTTSVSTVKETFWNCQQLLKILHGLLVQYEERDITLSRDYQRELSERLPGESVPQVFFNGHHLGVRPWQQGRGREGGDEVLYVSVFVCACV